MRKLALVQNLVRRAWAEANIGKGNEAILDLVKNEDVALFIANKSLMVENECLVIFREKPRLSLET